MAIKANKAISYLQTDRSRCLAELTELAYKGSILSMLYMADALNYYPVTEDDRVQARLWYQRAFEAGSVSARYRLAELSAKAGNVELAIELYKIGVEKGERRAAYWLGRTLYVDLNKREDGKKLLAEAAQNGHISARMFLAAIDMRGRSGISRIPHGAMAYTWHMIAGFREFSKDKFSTKLY